ncbi:50S ribosomal protein L18 [candidate division KSB1 bacterium]|nr:MAG: 50S ribosomal protein L18 [candidate division KSB1 bacterium]
MKDINKEKRRIRERHKKRIRKKIIGTAERPRLTVYRSLKNITAQLIDDENNRTLLTVTSLSKEVKSNLKNEKGKIEISRIVGKMLAEKARKMKFEKVSFDRSGYKYHGRVKALAEGAREGGLIF